MGEKSEQKKRYIIERARTVFAEKGYKAVTMKDIVEACDISRGGLYLYFGSTKELFAAVIAKDGEDEDDEDQALTGALHTGGSASDLLALFIKAQKKEVFRKRNNLTLASYEYFSEIALQGQENALKSQFETAIMIVTRLVEQGLHQNEFYCDEPEGWANNLMYVIEGMKVASHTMGLTEQMFDRQIVYALRQLVPEEV